jgi:hypothetical protein
VKAIFVLSVLVTVYIMWGAMRRSDKSAVGRVVRRHALPIGLLVIVWYSVLTIIVGSGAIRIF